MLVHTHTHTCTHPHTHQKGMFCHLFVIFQLIMGFCTQLSDRTGISFLPFHTCKCMQNNTHTQTHPDTHTHTHTQMYHVSGQNNIVLLVFCSHKSRVFLWINWPKIVALFQLIVVIDSQPFVMYAGVSKLVIVVKIKQKK